MIVVCPGCGRRYRLPETGAGRRVRCTACRHVFATEEGGAASSGPANSSPSPPPAASGPAPLALVGDEDREFRQLVRRTLESLGCVAIMPLASLIGSGMGILNPWNLGLIIEQSKVPVLVDAGVGTASDAAIAMELGCAGVLMNTAIALAEDPVRMAGAMRKAVEAGREAFRAGRMPRKLYAASPSSPAAGLIG